MSDFMLEPLDEDEEPDELSVCHHGVGFDEECEDCELEIEADDGLEDPDDVTLRECGYC